MNENRVVKTFMELASISSPSRHEENVRNYIFNRLEPYHLVIEEDNTGDAIGGTTGNIIIKINGKQKKHILFDAHMDTVGPCENIHVILDGDTIHTDHTTVLGADDKAGLACLLELIDTIMEQEEYAGPDLTFIFTVCEEDSLQGVKHLDEKYFKDADFAYILDGDGSPCKAVNKTPYGCKGELYITGKEAHSGVCPEEGVNALYVAAQAIVKCPNGRIDDATTCNMGTITGGRAKNIVMGDVKIEFEARSFELPKLQEVIETVKAQFQQAADEYHATFTHTLKYGTPGYTVEEDAPIVENLKEAMDACGLDLQLISCGGGSNANIYHMKGLEALNIGAGAYKEHSKDEYLKIDELLQASNVIKQMVLNHK